MPTEPLSCQYPEQDSNLQTLADQRCASVPEPSRSAGWRIWACRQWSRMESNHRFLGVNQVSLPLDHGTGQAEGEGLEPPSGSHRHLFSRQAPHPAGCLPSSSCGGWNRTNGLLGQGQASLPTATTPHREKCPAGVEAVFVLPPSAFFLAIARRPQLLVGSLEPLPLGQGHVKAEGEGVEPSRLVRSTAFEAAAIAGTDAQRWSGLPFRCELRRQESNLRRDG